MNSFTLFLVLFLGLTCQIKYQVTGLIVTPVINNSVASDSYNARYCTEERLNSLKKTKNDYIITLSVFGGLTGIYLILAVFYTFFLIPVLVNMSILFGVGIGYRRRDLDLENCEGLIAQNATSIETAKDLIELV